MSLNDWLNWKYQFTNFYTSIATVCKDQQLQLHINQCQMVNIMDKNNDIISGHD